MQKLKDVRVLTTCALLIAMCTILSYLKVPLTELIEIRFAFIPVAVGGMLFGPVLGGIIGFASDILGFIVKPTGAFNPLFTLSSTLTGVLYGFFFYKKKMSVPVITIGEAAVSVICSQLINSYALSILYGTSFLTVMLTRVPKNVIMFVVNTIILTIILKPAKRWLPDTVKNLA